MKLVKHHNGFIYYTKYKSSWVTLNKIKLKKKKTTQKHLKFWFIKMTPKGVLMV